MKLKEFGNAKFIIDFCSLLVVLIALFFYGSQAEFFRWVSGCVFEIALLFIVNRYVFNKNKPRLHGNASVDLSDTERMLNNAVLLLPQGLAIFYVLALDVFHLPLEKVSWMIFVLSAYVGINIEDITDKRDQK